MNVVIVDDHPLILAGLRAILTSEHSITLLGSAASASEAVELIARTHPDVALIDLQLGRECGLRVVRETRQLARSCRYIILTSSPNAEDFARALDEDVDGYALKASVPEDLLYGLRSVSRGRKYFDPVFIENPSHSAGQYGQLTPKESQVLRALGRGLTNREIAGELFITEHTVKKHVSQVLAKLGLADRTQAALWANSKGLAQYR